MKKNIFSFYFQLIKDFFSKTFSTFSKLEKIIILLLSISFIVSSSLYLYINFFSDLVEIPNYGGVYKEGIVVENRDDLVDTINRLTKIGLTKFDEDGNIVDEVAESWDISDDVKTYTFTIKDLFDRDEVMHELEKHKDKWTQVEIKPENDRGIQFRFEESFGPFLSMTTLPVLPYGPYEVTKRDLKEIRLRANDNFYLGRAYLNEIILKIYPNYENMVKDYQNKQIDGIYHLKNDAESWDGMSFYSFKLPRYNMLFINNDRDVFKTQQSRKKLVQNEKFDNEININVVVLDSVENREIVKELLEKWEQSNIRAEIFYKNSSELLHNIIPKRDYDLLIYGLDYGTDPDPYPFWHSTQSGEQGFNLANFSDIDADIFLEDARKTADLDVRKEKYEQFWNIFDSEVPAMILSHEDWIFGVSEKYKSVKTGYSIAPEDRFLYIYNWYIRTKKIPNNQ
jgi:hypothetical protein